MKAEDTPFPSGWWGTSLENVGLADQRPPVGTYGRYDRTSLPQLPIQPDGLFSWLKDEPIREEHIGTGWDGTESDTDIQAKLLKLSEACRRAKVHLPSTFQMFLSTPFFYKRVRSNTDCYISLPIEPTASPVGEGSLVRFLADSQSCVFWYLYLPSGTREHAVVSSVDFFGTEIEMQEVESENASIEEFLAEGSSEPSAPHFGTESGTDEDHVDCSPAMEIVFAEESFEAFMFRYWIENELWFSEYDSTPISSMGQQYLENYRDAPPDKLKDHALH